MLNKLKVLPGFSHLVALMPTGLKAWLRDTIDSWSRPSAAARTVEQTSSHNDMLARFLYENAFRSERFQDRLRLLGSGFKVYSQHDEDGIIEELFRRVGVTNRYFVEFGVGDGLENCTSYLLLKGWSGAWIDGSATCYLRILKNLAHLIEARRLRVLNSFITRDNIQALFRQLEVPAEPDLLSIDIDRNDYWIWEAITEYRPRVVAIEYNASWKHTVAVTVPYDGTAIGDGTNYFGASLKALEILGRRKGYALVGCNYTGVTAFFVREDLTGDHFARPFDSANHYEPPRYFVRMPNGHPPGFGPLVTVTESGDGATPTPRR